MVKHIIRIGLVSLLAIAMLLGASPVVHADGGDNADAVIDISIKGDPKVEIATRGTCQVNVKREASSEANTIGMFLSRDPAYKGGTVIEISISGTSEVDIVARGTCQVNVTVEGRSEVHINAGDEVELNVEASDESQVFVDDEKANDAPDDLDPDIEASDPYQAMVSDQNLNDTAGDDHSSGLNSLAIISGVFLGAGLPAFFLVRRKKEGR